MLKNILLLALLIAVANSYAASAKLNEAAPDFTLKGVEVATGKLENYKLSQFKDKTVVLEWFNKDCPYVHKMYDSKTMQRLQAQEIAGKHDVVWFTVVSSAAGKEGFMKPAEAKKVIKDYGLASTALLFDSSGAVAKLYGAKTTPHMFIVNQGSLAYEGAIDDKPSADPKSLQGAKNYVAAALDLIRDRKPIPPNEASTTPYGCAVKY